MTSYLRTKSPEHGKANRKRRLKRLAKRRPCAICGKGINPAEVSIDHIVPRSQGGCGEAWNLRPTHGACNSARGNAMEDTVEVRNAAFVHRAFGISRRV